MNGFLDFDGCSLFLNDDPTKRGVRGNFRWERGDATRRGLLEPGKEVTG